MISLLLQRKAATAKEPKPSTETETKQEESKENAPNNNDIKKAVSEEVSKPVPRPPPPPPPPPPDVSTECKFTAERMYEYQWPPDGTGEFYLLRHQVCQFLETENLEEKYSGQFELQI